MRTASLLLLLVACAPRGEEISSEPASRVLVPEELPGAVLLSMNAHQEPEPHRITDECSPKQVRACVPGAPVADRHARGGPYWSCVKTDDGYRWSNATCNTPLVVVWDGLSVTFTRPDGPDFRVGSAARTEWVAPSTPWLALDRNGDGCIGDESELFAGFSALVPFDDDGNGRIDERDAVFSRLLLWRDGARARACTPDELTPLSASGIRAISLRYEEHPPQKLGSYEGERSAFFTVDGRRGQVVDVHLAPTEQVVAKAKKLGLR